MVVTSENNDKTIITLSPNRSATWQQTKWVIAIMVAVVMIIALAWTVVGAWVVLPFAGLEVGLFALLMYKVSLFTHTQQIIYISATSVDIEAGYRKKETLARMSRHHLDIFYSESKNNWELPRVIMCANDQKVIIGEFLNLEDREKLKETLQDLGFMILRNRWW
jgi:uncharacterized membrane protein